MLPMVWTGTERFYRWIQYNVAQWERNLLINQLLTLFQFCWTFSILNRVQDQNIIFSIFNNLFKFWAYLKVESSTILYFLISLSNVDLCLQFSFAFINIWGTQCCCLFIDDTDMMEAMRKLLCAIYWEQEELLRILHILSSTS